MKKIILTVILFLASFSVIASNYDLVRTINTVNTEAEEGMPQTIFDTAVRDTLLGEFTHTGTMTVESNFINMNTISCLDENCVKENVTRNIFSIDESMKTAVLFDDDAESGFATLSILSVSPNVILLQVNDNGTINITEWKPSTE